MAEVKKTPVKKTTKSATPAAPKTAPRKKAAPKKTAPQPEQETKVSVEEIKVAGTQLLEKVKELIKEGNVRRIVIKQNDKVVLDIPMTLAAVGVVFAPVLAAVGAFAALISDCTLEVEKEDK